MNITISDIRHLTHTYHKIGTQLITGDTSYKE